MKLIMLILLGVFTMSQAQAESLSEFRKSREESLKKNWLVVSGLTWLKEGVNTLGSDPQSDVDLPSSVPAHLGKISFLKKKALITFEMARTEKGVVTLDGKPVQAGKAYELLPDSQPQRTVIDINGVQFYLIDRPNGIGVRVKDPEAATLKNFKGLNWWPEQKNFIVQGKWKELKPPKKIHIPDVLGNSNEETILGTVVFTFKGENFELYPTREKEDLFFVFKDATSGKESYGTGRFLEAQVAADGTVVLDFNRAYNPPCAQIKFATCPMAPPENKLKIAIPAGEKAPLGHP